MVKVLPKDEYQVWLAAQKPAPAVAPEPAPAAEPAAAAADLVPVTFTAEQATAGAEAYAANCAGCHSNAWPAPVPDLRRSVAATHTAFKDIVLNGLLQPRGMPRWDDLLDVAQVDKIHAYVISVARSAWDAQQKAAAGEAAAAAPATELKEGHL